MGDRRTRRTAPTAGDLHVLVHSVVADLAASHPDAEPGAVQRTVRQVTEELAGFAASASGLATLVRRRADARLLAATGHFVPITSTRSR